MADKAENTLYENGIGWAILLVVFAVLLWLFWYYFDTEVRNAVRWIRYGEMWLLSFFLDKDFTVVYNNAAVNWRQGFEDTPKWDASQLKFDHLSYFSALAMQPLRMVYVGIFAAAAMWCMFNGPGTQYRKKFNLEGLIERQSHNFPIIRPFVNFNPSNQPPRPPAHPCPLNCRFLPKRSDPKNGWPITLFPFRMEKSMRPPPPPPSASSLAPAGRARTNSRLINKFFLRPSALKASRKRKDADEMLGRLARCWSGTSGLRLSKDGGLLREARKILKNKDLAGKVLAQCNRHAFETTALLRGLAFAREEGGVLAPAAFVWLRGHDRALWYPLNNMGRQSFHPEAMGAMAHYKAERMTQRPIPVPKVEDGVTTIKEYMSSMRARPIPQLDYKDSKKRGVKKAV